MEVSFTKHLPFSLLVNFMFLLQATLFSLAIAEILFLLQEFLCEALVLLQLRVTQGIGVCPTPTKNLGWYLTYICTYNLIVRTSFLSRRQYLCISQVIKSQYILFFFFFSKKNNSFC